MWLERKYDPVSTCSLDCLILSPNTSTWTYSKGNSDGLTWVFLMLVDNTIITIAAQARKMKPCQFLAHRTSLNIETRAPSVAPAPEGIHSWPRPASTFLLVYADPSEWSLPFPLPFFTRLSYILTVGSHWRPHSSWASPSLLLTPHRYYLLLSPDWSTGLWGQRPWPSCHLLSIWHLIGTW